MDSYDCRLLQPISWPLRRYHLLFGQSTVLICALVLAPVRVYQICIGMCHVVDVLENLYDISFEDVLENLHDTLSLYSDGELIETRHWRVRVIFCEHFVRSGEDLQAIANVHGTSWQALYGINPQLRQSSDFSVQTNVKYGRLWSCDPPLRSAGGGPVHYQTETEEVKELFDHGCAILADERRAIGDRIVRVGLVLGPLQASQNIPSLVRDVGGSLRQTLAMNPSRIHLVSKNPLIADMMHPHGDGRLCVVSSLSQECPALPY